jgi:hypothetical protein
VGAAGAAGDSSGQAGLSGADAAPAGDPAATTVSVVPGIARYHRADCILIRFLSKEDLEIMTRDAATAGGCVPCRACQPDKAAAGAAAR